MNFVESYKIRKDCAEQLSKALEREVKPNVIRVAKHNGKIVWKVNLPEADLRKYINYCRYDNTANVRNGFISTPVRNQYEVNVNNEETEWMDDAFNKFKK